MLYLCIINVSMEFGFSFNGILRNNKIELVDKALFKRVMTTAFIPDESLSLTVTRTTPNKRTKAQNTYYWLGIIPFVQEVLIGDGYDMTHEQVHEYLRCKFLCEVVNNKSNPDLCISIPRSTRKLTVTEFSDYISSIDQWLETEYKCNIPVPQKTLSGDQLIDYLEGKFNDRYNER